MGWVTTEALIYDDRGELLSHSPTTYKIPAITDVPRSLQRRDVRQQRQRAKTCAAAKPSASRR